MAFGLSGGQGTTPSGGNLTLAPAPDRFSTNTTPVAPTFTQPTAVPEIGGNWATGGGSVPSTTPENQVGADNALVVRGIRPTSSEGTPSSDSSSPSTDSASSTPSTGGGDSGAGAVTTSAPSGGGILDNPLNPYAAPTYHFRLFVTGPGGGSEVTIAETGKTGFNIKDVKISGYYGPNPTTRNTNQTSLTITVVETMGASFLDGLVVAHQRVGTTNYQKAFYFLELYFLGYKETGEIVNPIVEGLPSGGKWKWKIVVSNIDTHLNEGGATYSMQCTIIHDEALNQEWLKTSEPYAIKSKKVGEFFTKLSEALNKSIVRNYKEQLTKYTFKLHSYAGMPNPENFELIETEQNRNDTYRSRAMSEGDRDMWLANIIRGQNITELCEQICGVSKQGRNLAIFGKQEGDDNKPPEGEFRTGVFYRAYPEVKHGDFHVATGNYKREVTFHIKPFRSMATQLHPKESGKQNVGKAVEQAKPVTRKRYDYIFTGLNTDVINFDIKFNTAWQAALPRFGGFEYFNDMAQTHAMYDKKGAEAVKAFKQSVSTAQNAASNIGQIDKALDTNKLGVDGKQLDITGDARLSGVLNQFKGFDQNTLSGENTKQLAAMKQVQDSNNAKYGQLGANGSNFVEDDLSYGQGVETFISFAQSAEGARRAAGAGMSGPHGSRGRSVYGSLLEQLYDPSMFQVIDLTIRGDPFWLGDAYEQMFTDAPPGKDAPDWTAGDTYFSLIFKYPNGVHEDSGTVQFRNDQTYTGIYRMATIESIFQDGMFTQILHATRLPKVDADGALSLGGGPSGAASGAGSTAATGTTNGSINPTNAFNLNGVNGVSNQIGGPLAGTFTQGFGGLTGGIPSFTQSGSSFPQLGNILNIGGG